jgi:hypothetical protein
MSEPKSLLGSSELWRRVGRLRVLQNSTKELWQWTKTSGTYQCLSSLWCTKEGQDHVIVYFWHEPVNEQLIEKLGKV